MDASCRAHAWALSSSLEGSPKETTMKEWLKPEITESEAGMEVTSYLPAELDRA
jgi:coenzyme PQQ precursor peptide PqqA